MRQALSTFIRLLGAAMLVVVTGAFVTTAAAQEVKGRFAYYFNDKEYPDHISACRALLAALQPPERYAASKPADADGNVYCKGTQGDGSSGYEMWGSQVEYRLICPENARAMNRSCECEPGFQPKGNACVAPMSADAGQGSRTPASASPSANMQPPKAAPLPTCPQTARAQRNAMGEWIIQSTLQKGTGRKGYEKDMFPGVEVGLPGWHRAHSQGAGTGKESPDAIYYAPPEVNLKWQNCGVEEFLRDLAAIAPKDEVLCLLTATRPHPGTLRLAEIQYKVTALKAGESPRRVVEVSLEVQDKRDKPRVTPQIALYDLPDGLSDAKGKKFEASRKKLEMCERP